MLSGNRKRSLGKDSRDREDCRDISGPQPSSLPDTAAASASAMGAGITGGFDLGVGGGGGWGGGGSGVAATAATAAGGGGGGVGGGSPGPSVSRLTDLMKKVRIDLSSGEMR